MSISSSKPSKRKHHTMVYDPSSSRTILFGGEGVGDVIFGDVWALHGLGTCEATWQIHSPLPDPVHGTPGGRHGHSAIYVPDPPRMILFGGRTGFDAASTQSDIWSLSLSGTMQWTRVGSAPTTPRYDCGHHQGCVPGYPGYLPRTHSAIVGSSSSLTLFGGQAPIGGSTMHDTWTVALATNSWAYVSGQLCPFELPPQPGYSCDNIPERRQWHTLVLDELNRMILFGGYYPDSPTFSNVWVSGDMGSSWGHLGEAPNSPVNYKRGFHSAIYDPIGDRLVVVGGYDVTVDPFIIFDAVTALDLPSSLTYVNGGQPNPSHPWYSLNPTGTSPGLISEHAAAYDSDNDRIIVFGGVNAHNGGDAALRNNEVWALEFDNEAPGTVSDLGSSCVGTTGLLLSFTAPGNNGAVGTPAQYDVRYSTSPITESNFASATQATTEPNPVPAGSYVEVLVNGLTKCKSYYFAMKSLDASCNWSPLSNVYSVRMRCSGMGTCGLGGESAGGSIAAAVPVAPSEPGVRWVFELGAQHAGSPYKLSIYDVAGRLVRTLARGIATPGPLELGWDLRTDSQGFATAGVYFARLEVGSDRFSRPVSLTR